MPNMFLPLNSGTSIENQVAQINKNFSQLDRDAVTKQFKGATNESLTFGKLPNDRLGLDLKDGSGNSVIYIVIEDGKPILKVAKEGQDASTATDDGLIFNSATNIFKIADVVEGTITMPGSDSSFVDIPTQPLKVAAFLGYGIPPNTSQFWGSNYYHTFPVTYFALSAGHFVIDAYMTAHATTGSIRVFLTKSTGATTDVNGDWRYKIYIFQETAN